MKPYYEADGITIYHGEACAMLAQYWLGHLRQQDELDASLAKLNTYKAPAEPSPDDDGEEHTSYWPIDLAALFAAGYEPQQPDLHPRGDGQLDIFGGEAA